MGGTASRSISETLNEHLTNISMDAIVNCTSTATQTQLLQFDSIGGDLTIDGAKFDQGASIDITCVMDSEKQNAIATKVSNGIAQFAKAQGQAVVSALGSTQSEVISKIKNKIVNNLSADTTQELTAIINQTQGIQARNIKGSVVIKDLDLKQSAKSIASSLLKTQAYNSAIADATATIEQAAESLEKNPIAGIINSIGNAVSKIVSTPILLMGAVILGLAAFYLVLKQIFGIDLVDIAKDSLPDNMPSGLPGKIA